MAAPAELLEFDLLTKTELRRWVNANPTRVNDRDHDGYTPLHAAAYIHSSLPLVLWLLDEKGADVNAQTIHGDTPLHFTHSSKIITALLDHGADPCHLSRYFATPLMWQAYMDNLGCVARLLQDPRVRATIDSKDGDGSTALNYSCTRDPDKKEKPDIVRHLLQAGANPFLTNKHGLTALDELRQHWPSYRGAIALLEQAPDAEKASLLVRARRLIIPAINNGALPFYVQRRMASGQPLPRVVLPRTPLPRKVKAGRYIDGEESLKLRTLLAFVLGMGGGPEGHGMRRVSCGAEYAHAHLGPVAAWSCGRRWRTSVRIRGMMVSRVTRKVTAAAAPGNSSN